ncbi:hypothetical protein LBMAG22_10050 [Bacteroidota bacterium]|nr:hypothetical protein LBMAG22_10050 [Bacteroidota bacterium]
MSKVITPILSLFLVLGLINSTNAQQSEGGDNYSKIKLLSAKLDSNKTVLVVKVDAPYKDSVEAVLTHSIGWVVEKKKVVLAMGPNTFSFNTAQLAEGSYRLILRKFEGNWSLTHSFKKD